MTADLIFDDPALGSLVPARLSLDTELTVAAWIECADARAEALQVVAGQWRIRDRFDRFAAVDAAHVDGLDTRGYYGAVFDGRHVYFVQELQPRGQHGTALRYDTHRPFSAAAFEAFDASRIDGLDTRGYYGGAFDGHYVHFTPRHADGVQHSRALRFDTTREFADASAWSAFDMGATQTHQGAAFDGRYVYHCPGYRARDDAAHGHSGRVIRCDTRTDFTHPSTYEIFDAETVDGLDVGNFDGGAFDGRYVYFVPLGNGVCLRYDTEAGYADPTSWQAFDASTVGMGICVGAVFDGRHLYYVQYANGIAVRFDTTADFRDSSSWSSADAGRTGGLDTRGFDGGFFDGRYVYFVPFVNDGGHFHGNWLRYDPLLPFDAAAAWSAVDQAMTDGLPSYGYNGGAFDGRFFYAAPWRRTMGDADDRETWDIHGCVLRYDTTGADAAFSLRACDYGHNGGLCAAVPGPSFLVNTEDGVRGIAAHRPLSAGRHHLAGVYDGATIGLYVDGQCAAARPASGRIQNTDVPIAIGHVENGLGALRGDIGRLRITARALSAAAIDEDSRDELKP